MNNDEQQVICGTCGFWQRAERKPDPQSNEPAEPMTIGRCRKGHPRIAILKGDTTNNGIWPMTLESDWCGEHSGMVADLEQSRLNQMIHNTAPKIRKVIEENRLANDSK